MQTQVHEVISAGWDSGDLYGSAMQQWFGISSALHVRGEDIPAEWCFRPGACLRTVDDLEDSDRWFWELLETGEATADDLRTAGNVLQRYVRVLERYGHTY